MSYLLRLLSESRLLRKDLDYHLLRGSMVFIFFIFGYQKWFEYEAETIKPLISHSPFVFWLIPAFGVRGAGWFLGTTEWLFGALLLLGFWNKRLGTLGAAGSIFTYASTVTIIPFLPDAWAAPAGGFPLMTIVTAFLVKDVVLFAASFYLLEQDVVRSRDDRLVRSPSAVEVDGSAVPGRASPRQR
jgi:uncharacterized membrane protein YkgB